MGFLYRNIVRPALFTSDPEAVHDRVLGCARFIAGTFFEGAIRKLCAVDDERLSLTIAGLKFANPFGLAAGFDKNCLAPHFFAALGFGHLELGTVTAIAQAGNPKPRIFRVARDNALINRMGFPSLGCEAVAQRLKLLRTEKIPTIIGINLGKSRSVDLDRAVTDYCTTFKAVSQYADYCTLNVSSPNTPELRKLQEKERLLQLLQAISEVNAEQRPIFLKVSPDLETAELEKVLDVISENKIAGVIATNTTLSRDGLTQIVEEEGGLSGAPLRAKALHMVDHIHRITCGALPIIGVGGISSIEDVLNMFRAGASAVQIYTGFIYEGPGIVRKLSLALLKALEIHGATSLEEFLRIEHARHLGN